MRRDSDRARRQVLAMSEDELRDDIRRLVGLDPRAEQTGRVGNNGPSSSAECLEDTVPVECKACPAPTLWAGLADMVIHGRTRRGEDPGRR